MGRKGGRVHGRVASVGLEILHISKKQERGRGGGVWGERSERMPSVASPRRHHIIRQFLTNHGTNPGRALIT